MSAISSEELALHAEWQRTMGASGVRLQKPGADLRVTDLRGANLGVANLRGADLRDADLRGADLGGADLRAANLGVANLRGADLGVANLRGANLGGADLRGVNLKGVNLQGAYFGGVVGIIDGGQRSDGWWFVLVHQAEGPMVAAGCRWFTLGEARSHWGSPNYRDRALGDESLDRVEMMSRIAERRDWPGVPR